jgi:hypothetical protein
MHVLSVGKPYNPARTRWPECSQYNYRGGQHELLLMFPGPTLSEVEAVRKGQAEFGLYVEPPVILVCYRFGAGKAGVPWSDATYDWHKLHASRPDEATVPPDPAAASPELRAILSVVLVDANDGNVNALRQVSVSPEFTAALHRAIRAQADAPAAAGRFEAVHQDIYRRHPTAEALAAACPVRTIGGA